MTIFFPPIYIQQMCIGRYQVNGYSKSFPEKKTVYEGCDGKNCSMLPRNRSSNSGFSIGFFWGNGECIEHHHSMSSYAKKLLEVLHIDSSWWPWLLKNFVVVTAQQPKQQHTTLQKFLPFGQDVYSRFCIEKNYTYVIGQFQSNHYDITL